MGFSFRPFKRLFGRRRASSEIAPDEIFLDSSNLPQFDRHQFEGRIEMPISRWSLVVQGLIFALVVTVFLGRTWILQVKEGEAYALRSERNRLDHTLVFSDRGVIYDRNNVALAWNEVNGSNPDFALRKYLNNAGISGLVGFLKYPTKDTSGFYFREDFLGMEGLEKFFDTELKGENGLKIVETDALGNVHSESVLRPPKPGNNLELSIDSRVQTALQGYIKELANNSGFVGGGGVMMDIRTGEVIAMASYPEYDSQTMTDGSDVEAIEGYFSDPNNPFLNRIIDGLYTPGSIVKPYVALGALNEGVIRPETQILSTGAIAIPNPYNPTQQTVFKDWKAHGWVDMRRALAVSSDVYFYAVGGGYENQRGIGISNINKYARMFGFGEPMQSKYFVGKKGVVPTPAWKKEVFDGEEWTLGNTYHTAIGQYGFQVTPIQVVRAVAALANDGKLIEPNIIKTDKDAFVVSTVALSKEYFAIIREGMRLGVTEGTAGSLNTRAVTIAAKTGTAELGASKAFVNSWTTGFFPYENPRYAFAVIMERGPVTNLVGASYVMRQLVDWMAIYAPAYLE